MSVNGDQARSRELRSVDELRLDADAAAAIVDARVRARSADRLAPANQLDGQLAVAGQLGALRLELRAFARLLEQLLGGVGE